MEALIAVGLAAGALVGMAGLAAQSVRSLTVSRDRSIGTVLAVQRMEQLLAEPSRPPDTPSGAIEADTPGFVEYLDGQGRVGGRDRAFEGTVYARRWSIAPLASNPRIAVVQVVAGRCRRGSPPGGACVSLAAAVRLTAVRVETW